jgi:hypothetical protein
MRVRTHLRGQSNRPNSSTQIDNAVRTRPRASISALDLGREYVSLDSVRPTMRPSYPRVQPIEAPRHSPTPPPVLPCRSRPSFFPITSVATAAAGSCLLPYRQKAPCSTSFRGRPAVAAGHQLQDHHWVARESGRPCPHATCSAICQHENRDGQQLV